MPVPVSNLVVALGSALTSALFSSTDSALASLSEPRRKALLEQPETPHKASLERYARSAYRLRSTYVVGRVICVGLTAVMLGEVVDDLLPGRLDTLLAVLATVLFVAPLSDAGSALARRKADTFAPLLAAYLRPFEILFYPIAAPLGMLAEWLTARFVPEPEEADVNSSSSELELKKSIISAEVEFMVDEGEKSGIVGAEPAEMIRNVLGFAELTAKDIMVPRNRVEGIEVHTPLGDVRKLVAESGHSRYPVFDAQLDNVVGILCAKDVFKADVPGNLAEVTLSDVLRPDTIFVHETQSLASMLREMRLKRHHLAVVVDEFGGTSGIATLEDVLEKIVGDIRDEHDEAEAAPIQDLGDGRLFANPDVSMGDLSAYLGAPIPEDAHDEPLRDVLKRESDTPEVGTQIEKYGLQFIVRDMDGDDVQRVEVVRPAAPTTEAVTSSST